MLVARSVGLLLLLAGGCTPLKEVNTFALASQATLDKAAAFDGYGRFDYCYDSVLVYTDTAQFLRQYRFRLAPRKTALHFPQTIPKKRRTRAVIVWQDDTHH